MKFFSRRAIKHEDLNGASSLFGGRLLAWIDEEAAIYASCQMGTTHLVTKLIGEIDFLTPARLGDVIEFGLETLNVGHTSLTIRCLVRNKLTHIAIVDVQKLVFVSVDIEGRPVPHQRGLQRAS